MKTLIVLALACLAAASSANLLVNGSFEDPIVDQNSHRNQYGTGVNFGGWDVVSTTSAVEHLDNAYPASYGGDFWWLTPAGNQFVYLASFTAESVIAQAVSLNSGTTYDFSFLACAFKGNFGTNYGLVDYDVLDSNSNSVLGGMRQIQTGDHADWARFSDSFSVQSTGNYSVVFKSVSGSAGMIDDVQLNPVPEPCTSIALGCGLVALLRRRRCRRA